MNIFSIPVYYISFNVKPDLEKKLKDVGFTNVNFFKAVNGKQFDPKQLRRDNIISIRSYNDIISNRNEVAGIPSMGAIGCTLSHYELWKMCMNEFDNIIILEDDVNIDRSLTPTEISIISESLLKQNGGFVSPMTTFNNLNWGTKFWGAHFYICSKQLCKKLVENAFPIDVQVEPYMTNLLDLNQINLTFLPIYGQKVHYSSIQDLCIKCVMPNSKWFYIISFLLICILIYLCVKCFKRCFGNKCGM